MTARQLVQKLEALPQDVEVVGSEYVEAHDEYYVKQCPFTVACYYSDADDGVGERLAFVYVGPEYAKPN